MKTNVGLHTTTENYYYGHAVLETLLGKETVTGLYSIAVRGGVPNVTERSVLDAIAVAVCSPDPRVWPLKLSRIVSSYGEKLAGLAASFLVCDNTMISPNASNLTAETLLHLSTLVGDKIDDIMFVTNVMQTFLSTKPKVIGLGVPFREFDERYIALSRWMKANGRSGRYFWKLQSALSSAAKTNGIGTNILLGTTAALLDLGYRSEQIASIMMLLIQSTFAANVFEAVKPEYNGLQSLPIDSVNYVGTTARLSPKKTEDKL